IGIEALTIHGRTRVQMYKGEADWSLIGEIKSNPRIHIPVFGNGDVDTPEKAKQNRLLYGVDGIMIGRASIGYPWIFREMKHYFATGETLAPPTLEERVDTCRTHFTQSLKWKGDVLGVLEMRRHYHPYFKGLPNFKPYRERFVNTMNPEEIFSILDEVSYHYSHVKIEQIDADSYQKVTA